MKFKNIPNWRTLAICAVFLTVNFPNPAYSKSNFLGKTLEVKHTMKCKGYVKFAENYTSIIRILGNGIVLFEFSSGKKTGIKYKLNSTIKTNPKDKLSWKINGKKVWKSIVVPIVATATQKGEWLILDNTQDPKYSSPSGIKIHRHTISKASVKISKDKCSSFKVKTFGWYRIDGGRKKHYTCKTSNVRCKMK